MSRTVSCAVSPQLKEFNYLASECLQMEKPSVRHNRESRLDGVAGRGTLYDMEASRGETGGHPGKCEVAFTGGVTSKPV